VADVRAPPLGELMNVHTLPPRGRGGAAGRQPAVQACSCKPNADGRCCTAKSCGCVRASFGCSPACHCRGFTLVCANANAALDKAAAKPGAAKPAVGEPQAKKAKGAFGGAFTGAAHKLADNPFEFAAQQQQPDSRAAFLDALERQQRGKDVGVGTVVPTAARPVPVAAVAAPSIEVVDLCDSSDEEKEAQRPVPAPPPQRQPAPALAAVRQAPRPVAPKPPASVAPYDPFNPPQYRPAGGFTSARELHVRETAKLRTVDGSWMSGLKAVLDTGNEGCTLVCVAAARRAGLVDEFGQPVGSFGKARTIEVHGAVAGAAERIPMMRFEYEIAGKSVSVMGAVTSARLGCDLLISRHDLLQFQSEGYNLSAKA
jgi:hypothetical protein